MSGFSLPATHSQTFVRCVIVAVLVGSVMSSNATDDGERSPSRPRSRGVGRGDVVTASEDSSSIRTGTRLLDRIGPFEFKDLEGRSWNNGDFAGRVLIVVAWHSACGPCVSGFPKMQRLYDKVRRDPSIAFTSFNLDDDPARLDTWFREFRNEYSFPVLLAGPAATPNRLPCTWIVDRDGYIRDEFFGEGPGWVGEAIARAEAVKRRLPVSMLPAELRSKRRSASTRH